MPNRAIREIIKGKRVISVPGNISVTEAAKCMKASNIGAVMVVEKGRLIGLFSERDALFRVVASGLSPQKTRVSDVMTPDPLTIHPDKPFGHALHLMNDNGFRHMPVVAGGSPVGMVSARDALSQEKVEFENEMEQRERILEILG